MKHLSTAWGWQRGLSLVEVVVVVAIIALLSAVVSGAVNILKGAEIRGFINDVQGFQSSIESFQLKYNYYPGDMPDATSYWDAANTANGDGDGLVLYPNENFLLWEHLNLAGFLEGGYTGFAAISNQADIGINVPASSRTKVGYYVTHQDFTDLGIEARNEIIVGAFNAGNQNHNVALLPQEANLIDNKTDDSMPFTGQVYGREGFLDNDSRIADGQCRSGIGQASTYNIANESAVACIMSFSLLP